MITIEAPKLKDLPELRRLLVHTWISTYRRIFSPKTIAKVIRSWHNRKLIRSQIMDTKLFFRVARDERRKIVGLITANRVGYHELMIRRLYVHPKYQRRRIGKKLLDSAITYFSGIKKIALEVVKENKKARLYYLRKGFKLKKLNEVRINGDTLVVILMEKKNTVRGNHAKYSRYYIKRMSGV